MSAARLPENEQTRLAALRAWDVLDTAPSAAFDAVTRAASLSCRMPIALISLVDEHRQWFKSNIGLDGVRETARALAFCAHTILSGEIFEVVDATKALEFADNPLVIGDPGIRAYAGAPLVLSDGSRVGTLSVIDRRPRRLSARQRGVLTALAQAAALALEQWRAAQLQESAERRLRESQEILERTGELAAVAGWSLDLETGKYTWTRESFRIYGVPLDFAPQLDAIITFYDPDVQPKIRAVIANSLRTGEPWDLELPLAPAGGQRKWVHAIGKATLRDGKPVKLSGALQDISDRVKRVRALQVAQERAALAMDSGKIGIWDWDLTTGEKTWSKLMFQLYGMAPDQPTPEIAAWLARLHDDDRERAAQALREAIAGLRPYDIAFRVVWDDGSVHHLRAAGTVKLDEAGNATRMTGANWDVTESHELTEKLAHQHELLRVTLQSIGDGVITTDAAGLTAWMNPVAERMTGWTTAQAQGRPLDEVLHIVNEETREPALSPVEVCLAEGRLVALASQTILISRDGEEYSIEDSASPIRSEAGEVLGVVLVFHDVTAQRRLSGEMAFRATHDSLTGLLNRAEFEVRLRHTLHTSQTDRKQSVMLFIDLDQFKLVNDTCGHEAGDQLLRQIARLLSELVRGSDAVARLGGDEFAVLLDRCTVEQGLKLAQKVCERMEEFRFIHQAQRFQVGASIGLVPVDERWPEIAGIMQAADASCYAAKEGGRNRVHQWSDTDKAMNARHGEMKWASRLAQALDEDRFVLFAQRIQALQTTPPGIHAEVLLRKVNLDKTLSPPGAFLPAAERFHMITRIDRWVLDHAIAWMAAVPALEAIGMLSVNVSGQSVGDAAFQLWAISRLEQAGPRICHRLCLEITETAVVTSLADAAHFIEQVRAIGVRVALDDFGAGASSFGYLKSLPVDFLKIDGQFVRDLIADPLDQAAVRSFTDVAAVAGLRTIAEFVDNQPVMDKLRAMGVDYAQGYLVHKPAPIDELLTCVKAKEAALS
jgi:diguanylate cyclase (GGDEF)-like protein/PAS domain S-box-containing protein